MKWRSLVALATATVACRVGDLVETPVSGARLEFSAQPSRTKIGEAITPAVRVTVRDEDGRPDSSYHESVALDLGQNPGGAELNGTLSAPVQDGVATFADLRVNKPGIGYVLRATAPGRPAVMSSAFGVDSLEPPVASTLAFTAQPTNTEAGDVITPAVRVAARDADGNLVTSFTGTITLAIGNNPAGGSLAGSTSIVASGGVATFGGLRIDRAGNGYTLTAAASGLTGATSAAFNITAPPQQATQLAFTVQPTTTEAGDAITPAIRVAARDASGNVVTSFTGTITLAIGSNPGGGTLSGTTSVVASGGVATFSGLRIDRAGNDYTLRATAGSLTAATSDAFNITAPPPTQVPTGLRFIVQPSNTGLNQQISPPVQVEVLDQNGVRITNYTGAVTINLQPNPLNASVYGTVTVNAANGVATFSNLRVNLVGIDFRLQAAFAGQAPIATSNAFIVLL